MNFTTKEPEEEKVEEDKDVIESKLDEDEGKETSKEESGFGGIFSKQITPPPEPELAVAIVDPDQGSAFIRHLVSTFDQFRSEQNSRGSWVLARIIDQ